MEEIFKAMDLLDMEFDGETWENPEHGKLLEVRMEAYHDVFVYEDGHEERYYIGD